MNIKPFNSQKSTASQSKIRLAFSANTVNADLKNLKSFKPVILYLNGLKTSHTSAQTPFENSDIVKKAHVYTFSEPYIKQTKVDITDFNHLVEQASSAVKALSDKHNQSVQIAGFSLGGLIAAYLGAKKPDRISQLLLINPSVTTSRQAPLTVGIGATSYALASQLQGFKKASSEKPMLPVTLRTWLELGKAMSKSTDIIKAIKLPTFFLLGAKNQPLSPTIWQKTVDQMPGTNPIFWVKNQGHYLPDEIIQDTINRLWLRKSNFAE